MDCAKRAVNFAVSRENLPSLPKLCNKIDPAKV